MKSSLKVLIVVSLALTLAVLPLLAACAAEGPGEEPLTEILIGGGGVGGTFYPMSVGLMTILNDNMPGVRATALATGGSLSNIRQVDAGEIDIGFGTASKAAAAYKGGGDWERPHKIKLISSMFGAWSFWLTLDKNIKTLYDVEGKRVAIGEPGATTALIGEAILKGVGFEKNVDYDAIELGEHEASEAILDGRVDVIFTSGSKSTASIIELTTARDVYFIPFPLDKADVISGFLEEAGAGRPMGTLSAGTYEGMDEEYKTFVAPMSMFMHTDADEEFVYTIVKTLWEDIETLGKVHPAGYEFDTNDLKLNFGYPLHPGALRYYKEVGALTEDPYKG